MLTLTLLACACAPAAKLTVLEHRNEAGIHERKSLAARARAEAQSQRAPPRSISLGQSDGTFDAYSPAATSTAEADAELRKANAHLAAARTLIAFEARACEGLSEAERTACPLFASTVERVLPDRDGLVLHFKPGVDVAQTYRQLSCHLAYAASTGFDRPSCPLFVKGMMISRNGDRGIAFLGENDEVTGQLQAAARALFLGSPVITRLEPR